MDTNVAASAAAMKYVLVTGGVISGIGKGVVASSVGVILKHCNVPATRLDDESTIDYTNLNLMRKQKI